MAIADDISVAINGDIRYTGSGATYTVLELHRFLQDKADDAVASGDDLLDITDDTPSERATDNIITLINGYNIDDTLAQYIYDGSITQDAGATKYQGLVVVGAVSAGTQIQIVQNNELLPSYWGTGLNPDAAANILLRIMVKTRVDGADINGRRLLVFAREYGDTYAEFAVTMGDGNNTAALFTGNDLNNATAETTVQTYDKHDNTEGYQLLDVTAAGSQEEFYSQWQVTGTGTLPASPTINDLYEFAKWIQKRPTDADSATETGSDFVVDNATITGQGQEFTARATHNEILTGCKFFLKIAAGTPVGELVAELWLSDDVGAGLAEPTGAVLATSDPVLPNVLTSTYQEITFAFNDGYTMTAGEKYFIVIRNTAADASNNVHVRGSTAGSDDGNRAQDASGVWTATAADDLSFSVQSSPVIHGMPGSLFRGINLDIDYDGEAGDEAPATNDDYAWGTFLDTGAITGTFQIGEKVTGGTSLAVGRILSIDTTNTSLVVQTESGTWQNGEVVTGFTSGATATTSAAPVGQATGGGLARILAVDDNGTTGTIWVQILKGSAPADNAVLYKDGAGNHDDTLTVQGTPVSRPISSCFIGSSTGSAIIGAFGVGIDPTDLTASDLLLDLQNATAPPPNNVTFTVSGLVSGEDRVLVGPEAAGVLQVDQFGIKAASALTTDNITSVAIDATIPSDTPATGYIRVFDNNGVARRLHYSSYTGDTFTIDTVDGNEDFATVNANVGNDVFIAYIDELASGTSASFTSVYLADRALFVRVRDGDTTPIKTFETPATLGSTGGSATAIRTSDA